MAASLTYKVNDRWDAGFTAEMTVRAGAGGLNGWVAEFDAAFDITSLWGGEIVSHVGTRYVVRNLAWNATLPADGAATFGFQASSGAAGTSAGNFILNGAPAGGGAPPAALPQIAVADVSVAEGDAGTKVLTFAVDLSKAAGGPVTVRYATADGTAVAGSDFAAASGTLTFAAGETRKTVSVTVLGDTVVEGNEGFLLNLSGASGATLARGSATGTILDDDAAPAPAPVPPGLTVGDAAITEGNSGSKILNFTVKLSKAAAGPVTVRYATADGTAAAGSDYTATSGILTFAAGETSKTVAVAVLGDTRVEGVETFSLLLSAPSGATLKDATGVATIRDNDVATPPGLTVGDAAITEGNSGSKILNFTVKLSKAAAGPVTVRYATADGTAVAGADYAATSGTLTFAAGETSKTVAVAVLGDTRVEGNETFSLLLSAPAGATLADATGVATIRDNDAGPAPVPPGLSVADAAVAEGNAGTGAMTFTVSLDKAAAGAVTVRYATADGTAVAGSDYVATSGTLTFAAGETSRTVTVGVLGDTAVERDEAFALRLSAPSGATLTDATATGTIRNDDAAPALPTLSVNDVSVTEGNPGTAGGTAKGFFSTVGNQIVDAAGTAVKIAGVNWFGLESANYAPHGLWARGYKEMMDQMADLGFNTIRLPFSSDVLHGGAPNGIDFSKNADLQGLTGLQIMDRIVDYAGQAGLRIILDHHRSGAGNGASENGLWYDAGHPEAGWIADWKMLAARYAGNATVIGADLHNEPYNGVWGGGGANDWAAAAERAGDAIGTVNPDWLIFVEGVGTYRGESYWWGGNLMGVRDRPIDLALDNKLVYSVHDYPNSVYAQPWFQGDFANTLTGKFDEMWGYIYRENIAPIYVGEFGSKLEDPKDAVWLDKLTAYLSGDLDANGTRDIPADKEGASWTWWSWNPNSGDTGGILKDDWTSVQTEKLAELKPIQFDLDAAPGIPGDAHAAAFTVTLSAASATAVTVKYATLADTAAAGSDFTPTTGTLTFAPGETSKTIAVPILADGAFEADERFSIVLSAPSGATMLDGTGVATVRNDDAAARMAAIADEADVAFLLANGQVSPGQADLVFQ